MYDEEACQSCGSSVLSCGHCSSVRDENCEDCQEYEKKLNEDDT